MAVGIVKEQSGQAGAVPSRTQGSESVQKALRNLMFCTAHVPLTDGHKMKLRHIGHAMNIVSGPLTTFSTHNYADTYSCLLKTLCEGSGSMPQQEEPSMPTLQEMHKMTAASPVSTAKFWLLRQELSYRHLYGMDRLHIGSLHVRTIDSKFNRENHWHLQVSKEWLDMGNPRWHLEKHRRADSNMHMIKNLQSQKVKQYNIKF